MNSTLALISGLGLGLGLETSGLGLEAFGLGLVLGLETPGLANIPGVCQRETICRTDATLSVSLMQ